MAERGDLIWMIFTYYFRDAVHLIAVAPDGSVPWVGTASYRVNTLTANQRIRAATAETPGGVVRD